VREGEAREGSKRATRGTTLGSTTRRGATAMGLDRNLDQEGIPDLEGPLPEKAATGDPQEGASPPTDRPASQDYGVTADEQSRPEPLDVRLARERADVVRADPDDVGILVAPEDEALGLEDDDADLVARRGGDDQVGTSAEEAAMHVVEER
jgi:hypothetical protein